MPHWCIVYGCNNSFDKGKAQSRHCRLLLNSLDFDRKNTKNKHADKRNTKEYAVITLSFRVFSYAQEQARGICSKGLFQQNLSLCKENLAVNRQRSKNYLNCRLNKPKRATSKNTNMATTLVMSCLIYLKWSI